MLLAESVLNSQFFTKTAVIMFFNKADLLAQKMSDPKQQIKPYFPDFDGTSHITEQPARNTD